MKPKLHSKQVNLKLRQKILVFVPEYISLFVEKMANLMAMVLWPNVWISEQNVKGCVLVERDKYLLKTNGPNLM